MSTASAVPETFELAGDDAKQTLRKTGWAKLLKDSFERFRAADGSSHVRALAYSTVLTIFPALITAIGIASVFRLGSFRRLLAKTLQHLAPGPAETLLNATLRRGADAGGIALVAGLVGAVVAATLALVQVERGCNRIYGIERDRDLGTRLWNGLLLALTAVPLFALAFVLLAAGGSLAENLSRAGAGGDSAATIFEIVRWPAGLLLTFAALTTVYKFSPDRRQPAAAWLQTGTVMATLLWFGLTVLLAVYYGLNENLGDAYGPLLGIIALLTWAYATALALFLGIAFAGQLEAVRAGVSCPRTTRRYNETVRGPSENSARDEPHLVVDLPHSASRP